MAQENQVLELLETMLRLPPGSMNSATSLTVLNNSLGEAKLRLGLKRLGVVLPPGFRPASFGELWKVLNNESALAVNSPVPLREKPALGNSLSGLRVGLDIQDVASLPVAADYWEEPFYSSNFAKREIAYAVMHSEPRIHFAGFWCAKEALRKCDSSFALVEPAATIVAHETEGAPFLIWTNSSGETRLPHAVSISHTGAIAIAVVALTKTDE